MKIHITNIERKTRRGVVWLPNPKPTFTGIVDYVPPDDTATEPYVSMPPIKAHELSQIIRTEQIDSIHSQVWMPGTIIEKLQVGDKVYYYGQAEEIKYLDHRDIIAFVRDGQTHMYGCQVFLEPVELPQMKGSLHLVHMKQAMRDTQEGAFWTSETHYKDRGRIVRMSAGLRGLDRSYKVGDVVIVHPRMMLSKEIEGQTGIVLGEGYLKGVI